jgi:hypothetical protein
MTRLTKVFLLPVLGWIGFSMPSIVQAQSGSRQASVNRNSQSVAVVELFTSQGCSSCPSADSVLQDIAKTAQQDDLPIFALSFHVDYWNRLGWNDPYSDASFSERQRSYARGMRSSRVYTPQMIVNGTTEFVGSHRNKAKAAIAKALRKQAQVTIDGSLRQSGSDSKIDLHYDLTGQAIGKILNVAIVETPKPTSVPRGENAGRSLTHVNVVRDFRSSVIEQDSVDLSVRLPDDVDSESVQVIAYVQDRKTLSILGATALQ